MLKIISSPVYTAPQIGEEGGEFNFNVCATGANPRFRLLSYQAEVASCVRSQTETGMVQVNLTAPLTNPPATPFVVRIIAADPAPEDDDDSVQVRYDGRYMAAAINNGAALLLHALDSTRSTFTGRIVADPDGAPVGTVTVLDGLSPARVTYSRVASQSGVQYSEELTTEMVPADGFGEYAVPLGEVAEAFGDGDNLRVSTVFTVPKSGGGSDSVQLPTVVCVPADYWAANYGDYTLLNPLTGGRGLPTCGPKCYYDPVAEVFWPVYANYVLNDDYADLPENQNGVLAITVRFYVNGDRIALRVLEATAHAGLNAFNLASSEIFRETMKKYHPDALEVLASFWISTQGDFNKKQFAGDDFYTTEKTPEQVSAPVEIHCVRTKPDDRRNCVLTFPNGIGGLSTAYTSNFQRSVEPETAALRTGSIISSSLIRETEVLECTFDQLTADEVAGLTGYDPRSGRKVNGIAEARRVTRVLADLSTVEYIPEQQTVQVSNQSQYWDVVIRLYRTL